MQPDHPQTTEPDYHLHSDLLAEQKIQSGEDDTTPLEAEVQHH